MSLHELSDEKVLEIANPILDNILEGARTRSYDKFSRDFDARFAEMVNIEEFERQQSYSVERNGHIKGDRQFLKCLRNEHSVMVLWIGEFEKLNGEILTGLNLREIDSKIKVVGIWHHH